MRCPRRSPRTMRESPALASQRWRSLMMHVTAVVPLTVESHDEATSLSTTTYASVSTAAGSASDVKFACVWVCETTRYPSKRLKNQKETTHRLLC